MNCPNCQNAVPESAKVCGYCGHNLSKPGKKFCTNCGEEIPATAKVCGYCGTRQEQAASVAPVPLPVIKKDEEILQSSAVDSRGTPAPKAKLPGWVIPAGVAVLLVVIAGAFLLTRPKTAAETEAPVQVVQTQVEKAAEPAEAAPVNTPQPAAQLTAPFYVGYSCENEIVPANASIRVTYGWVAASSELVTQYFDATQYTAFLDGQPVNNLEYGSGELIMNAEGYPSQKNWMEIGSLQPGPHEIKTIVNFSKKITDGEGWYGPGTDNTNFERICTVIAKDIGQEAACNFAKFVSETIPDKSKFSPGQRFTKSWTLMNTGACPWAGAYKLVFSSGSELGANSPVSLSKEVKPNEQVTVDVPFTAPSVPGIYTSRWKLQSNSGVNFFEVYSTIVVE